MLARLETVLPRGLEWIYEPKLDGFRGLMWRSSTAVRLLSRNLKDLSASFQELVRAPNALPLQTVIDGEMLSAVADASHIPLLRGGRDNDFDEACVYVINQA
jgi:ATP-dependent DNA ligase